MKSRFVLAAAAFVVASSFVSQISASDATPPKKSTKKAATTQPTNDQIEQLRQDLESQINALRNDLAGKDAELKKAQQDAADARAEAGRAEAAALAQPQNDNASAVTKLESTVNDLKANQVSLATTISDETTKLKAAIENPTTLHYKGIAITPGGFAAAETVYRSKSTGGDIPTAFNALPYEGADAYSLSEFYGSGRQSRLSLLAEGKTNWGKIRGYFEGDFLGSGTTSNANQSNSYVFRQRVLYAQAETNSRWLFAGGQMWSLATEGKVGIPSSPSDIMTPLTIDPNYVPGFAWARQYGFRVVKSFQHAAFGISAENPQLLYTATLAGNTPYAVLGSAGNNGGAYNATVSASVPTTYIQNYGNQAVTTTGGTGNIYVPIYNTIYANTNIANLSFNQAPDILIKAAFDPKYGHFEIFGIAGFAHETIYPGVTTNSTKYGGQKDIVTGTAVVAASSTANSIHNSIVLGGFGASLRVPLIPNKLTFGAKGLYGPGMGRYGDSTLADVTANAWGGLEPIHNLSGLFTVEATPTPRLTLYFNYGGDYAGRADFANLSTTTLGSPSSMFCPTTPGAFACTANPTAANVAAGGTWGGHWGAPSLSAVGYGSRLLSNSSCNTLAAPGYNGSSTGYYPGGSCGAQTRNVQEATGGYWYDIYKGDRGRIRQGVQYGYAVREGWSGVGGIGAKGIDNMFWTTFRYYLP